MIIRNKIYNLFRKIDLNNPLEFARQIVAPLCKEKIDKMILECNDCKSCSSCDKKTTIGNPYADILIINDNATDREEIDEYMMNIIETANLSLDDVFIINSVSCVLKRDFNGDVIIRNPRPLEAKNCKYFVNHAIDFVNPKVIIVMGVTGLSMYKKDITMEEAVGQFIEIQGKKAIVTFSAKDLFAMLEYMDEEEVNNIAENVLKDVVKAKEYLNSLERR